LDWFKINFDIIIRDSLSAQSAVCRDHQGCIIKMVSQISPPCLPNFGEALAACLHTNRFIIEGDFRIVILAIQDPCLS
jgi:hypothetical protein